MDRESVNRLRFDRRLEQRRDWAEDDARAANLESLPDVSAKMTQGLDEPEDAPVAAPSQTQAQFSEPAPIGGFSTSESTSGGSYGGTSENPEG